jgi:NTP pyrophosphatase (non-canonical NTP hydrolase)
MIKPMTDEEVKRCIADYKVFLINRRKEYNGYAEFVESMILTEGPDRLVENTLGLVGEAGEVAEKIKKKVRDGNIDIQGLQKELGDVIFYWYALHGALGLDPEVTKSMNKEKLTSRKERGTLQGNGDNR